MGLIILEAIVSHFMGKQVNRPMDMISSLSSGMTFTLKQLLGLSVVIISYKWLENHLSIFDLQKSIIVYVLAFVGLDFAGYWQHRFNHSYNILWNRHIIHHSSEEFNLACALRQNISVFFQIYFFLYIPMAIIGIPPAVVASVAPIHFFAQFWYHTKLINKMGILEHIIVTPSHHRVHHAINDEYIDKNFAEIFIIWDKLFGTFQEELAAVPAVYGIKKPAQTWNPVLINFQHLWRLIKDAWRTKSWRDKFRIWMMPTGWRPKDVAQKYPIAVDNPQSQVKYDTSYSKSFLVWIAIQFLIMNVFQYFLLISIADFSPVWFIYCVIFLFTSIFSYTSLMDGHKIAMGAEFIKVLLGFVLVSQSDLLPRQDLLGFIVPFFSFYLVVSVFLTLYFLFGDKPRRVALA